MKIPKLFKKAAAFVMAAVTALSIMPATAFAAGDIGTISFSHTYDSNGNAMRYNSSANIGGYTAGGTGNYKYRMFVDGENAFCIQPGVPLKTGNTLKKASSDTWNALSANQKKAVGLALLYGYQGNRNNLSGSDDEKWLATQTLVWEFVTGCREATGSYNQTSTTVYSLHFGSNYANSGARAVYDQIVAMLREHNTIPSFMSGGKNDITKELAYKDGKYSITLNDSNGVLSDYSFLSSDSNVSVSKSGNKLTISSTVAISGSVRITAKRNNVPTVSSSAKLIAYGDPNRKYWTIIGKGWKRPKRLYKLGEEYTNDRIMERISENSYAVKFQSFSESQPQVKVYRVKGSLKNARKIGGLRGLYLHYCYKLGILPKGRKQNYARLHYLLKDDLMKMEAITQETRLLCRNHIDTAEQLCSYKGSLEMEMSALLQKRKELYSKSRRTSGEEKEAVKAELSDISGRLKIIRKEVRLCEGISARSDTLKEKLQTIRADEHEQQRKELMKNEHRRRSGRTNRPNELGGL